jgi:hypothetical protein
MSKVVTLLAIADGWLRPKDVCELVAVPTSTLVLVGRGGTGSLSAEATFAPPFLPKDNFHLDGFLVTGGAVCGIGGTGGMVPIPFVEYIPVGIANIATGSSGCAVRRRIESPFDPVDFFDDAFEARLISRARD